MMRQRPRPRYPQCPARCPARPPVRAGFSLIELLVVITIIAVLLGLILSAVGRVLVIKARTETMARMTAINNAVTTQKGGTGGWNLPYIPQGGYLVTTPATKTTPAITAWAPFRLQNTYPSAAPGVTTTTTGAATCNSPEAQYIIQVFGVRPSLDSNNYPYLTDLGGSSFIGNGTVLLDANQTLTFFLTGVPQVSGSQAVFQGFSTSPTQPFSPRATAAEPRLGPALDLGGSQKYLIDASGFARLTDAYNNPFAFFSANKGQANQYYGGNNTFIPPGNPVPIPYSTNGQYENANGFQLISSGRDGFFGATGNWSAVDANGQDDQANFSAYVLGAGK